MTKAEDILKAADWCLFNVPPDVVSEMALLLRPYANDFTEDRPEVAAILKDLRYPRNRKSSWSLACAIIVRDSWDSSDLSTFWAAGIEVLKAWQQGKRGGHHNRNTYSPDALDSCIAEYLADHPSATPEQIFLSFTGLANSLHAVIVEHECDSDELVCQLVEDSDTLTNVGRDEFKRRVRRATGCT